jgi:hypothetical protein
MTPTSPKDKTDPMGGKVFHVSRKMDRLIRATFAALQTYLKKDNAA